MHHSSELLATVVGSLEKPNPPHCPSQTPPSASNTSDDNTTGLWTSSMYCGTNSETVSWPNIRLGLSMVRPGLRLSRCRKWRVRRASSASCPTNPAAAWIRPHMLNFLPFANVFGDTPTPSKGVRLPMAGSHQCARRNFILVFSSHPPEKHLGRPRSSSKHRQLKSLFRVSVPKCRQFPSAVPL